MSRKGLLVVPLLLLGLALACNLPSGGGGPTVVITAVIADSLSGSQMSVGKTVEVAYRAESAQGLARVDLLVNGQVVDTQNAPLPRGAQPVEGTLRWVPQAPGSYTLFLTAYDTAGQAGSSSSITIQVISAGGDGGTVAPPVPFTPVAQAPPAGTPIAHQMRPAEPPAARQYMWDFPSSQHIGAGPVYYSQGGDIYDNNAFERPFRPQTQDAFFGDLDIHYGRIARDGTWFYVTIELAGLRQGASTPQGNYGVELDLDKDGRGDYLVWVAGPLEATQWDVKGVAVYRDANNDVGGARACLSDSPYGGDGYEQALFQAGVGSDPDLAWARWVPGSPLKVQIAFKRSMISDDGDFIWWVWADEGVNNPRMMDYNDHYTRDQAGSPYKGNRYFPSRSIAAVDNTCRWVFGFTPTGKETCLCEMAKTPTPPPTKTKPPTEPPPTEPPPTEPPPPTTCTAEGDPGICWTAWIYELFGDVVCPASGDYGWETRCQWSTDSCTWGCWDVCVEASGAPDLPCSSPGGWEWTQKPGGGYAWYCTTEERCAYFDSGSCQWEVRAWPFCP